MAVHVHTSPWPRPMANERGVFAHELRPNQGFRIVVTGEVDSAMVQAMAAFATFQKALVGPAPAKDKPNAASEQKTE